MKISVGDQVLRTTEPRKAVPEEVVRISVDGQVAQVRWESSGVWGLQWVSVKLLRPWAEHPG